MEPVKIVAGAGQRARPRRRRHRPDHPQAVPQADRADRLRRVPLLRLGARSPAGTCPPNPILATGPNFGCGSSREHAPWALEDYGFKAIVAPSFADIFFSNCTKIGLLPVVLPERRRAALMEAGEAEVDLEALEVRFDGRAVPFELDDEIRHRLLDGLDDIALTLQQADAIEAYESDRERDGPVTTAL